MKTKRNLMLAGLLCALMLPTAAQADFTYTTLNGQVTITGYSGTPPSALVISNTINGLPVVSIGDNAFYQNSGLTSVTIPNSVTSIGDSAFNSCSGLTSLTIGNGVTSIGLDAFNSCSGLTSVMIPNSVTNIGDLAFKYCSGLTSVTIGNGVISIGLEAFGVCSGLTSVTIPSSVTFIDQGAFFDCYDLTAAYFEGNPPTLVGSDVFFNDKPNLTIYYPVGTTGWSFTNPLVPYFMVRNGGFDDTGAFDGWTVTGNGSAQVIGPNVYSGPYAAVFNETATTVGPFVPGTTNIMSQTLPTQPGASYVLSFAVNGIAGGYCYISWNGVPVGQSFFNPGWTMFHYVVKATSANTVLQFSIPTVFEEAQTIAIDSVSVLPEPQIAAQRISGGKVQLSAFTGAINANYALDRTASLTPPVNWVPQVTNLSDALGNITFTNTPNAAANNFWRFRSVP